jgi:L-threonylcarbamoyladenylate synthase
VLVRADTAAVARAGALLRAGGLVAFPTETVYGLGANAFDPLAVARIFEAKGRPSFDPLIVHVLDDSMLRTVVAAAPESARRLIERFWPGPLTLVLEKAEAIPGIVTAGLGTVAVRSPAHPVARALIAAAGLPLAAPSANRFGALSPTRAAHVAGQLGEGIDLILDAGQSEHGVESTIVLLAGERPALLRHGALPLEEIEAVAGPLADATQAAGGDAEPLSAPGRLASHYAPRTPLRVVPPATVAATERGRAGLLAFRLPVDGAGYAAVRVLSPAGDLREAAAGLFAALHDLDALGLARIDAEPVPETGIGRAIADRLRRAAARGLTR